MSKIYITERWNGGPQERWEKVSLEEWDAIIGESEREILLTSNGLKFVRRIL